MNDRVLERADKAFEAWWTQRMGDRMSHSKYLARAAWRCGIMWFDDNLFKPLPRKAKKKARK